MISKKGSDDINQVLKQMYEGLTGKKVISADKNALMVENYTQEIRHYFGEIIEKIPCIVYWKDRRLRYVGCNQEALKFLHLKSMTEIVGKTDFQLFSDKKLAKSYREMDRAILLDGQAQLNQPGELVTPEGKRLYTLVSKAPIRNLSGKVIGVVGITVDITKEKQAEIAKDHFISNMQHDLRTPFAGIGGMANVLQVMCEEKYPELSEFVEIMVKSCEQWENVHHRIFDVLAVEQIAPIKPEMVSISKEVEKIQAMLAAILHLKKIHCILKPVPPELDLIETDALKFHLILSSLICNAVNFTEEGEVTVTISREHNCRIIKVIDTGIGIPDDKFEYIFEKFTKLSLSNKHGGNFKGVGLGLYTARSYANQLGATIHVESQLGKGSTFYVKLPLSEKNV